MTPEGKIKNQLDEMLLQFGRNIFTFKPMSEVDRGIPDFVGCINGRFFAVETKSKKGSLKGIQELKLFQIDVAGGKTFVVRNTEDIETVFGWLVLAEND